MKRENYLPVKGHSPYYVDLRHRKVVRMENGETTEAESRQRCNMTYYLIQNQPTRAWIWYSWPLLRFAVRSGLDPSRIPNTFRIVDTTD